MGDHESQTSQQDEIEEDSGGYCCAAKKYYLTNDALAETLEIIPRVIIYKKYLKVKDAYEQVINIKNKGMYARHLKYSTDSSEDTNITIYGIENKYIDPGASVQIKITIDAETSKNINRRRHIYVTAEHPNITFEIPIIVLPSVKTLCIPELIRMPRTTLKNRAFYEFTIFNPTFNPYSLVVKTINALMNIKMSSTTIRQKNYVRVLVALLVKSSVTIKDQIKVKTGDCAYITLHWTHEPITYALYINQSHLHYEEILFNRTARKKLIICNESQVELKYNVRFQATDASANQHKPTEQELRDAMFLSMNNPLGISTVKNANCSSNPSKHFGLQKMKNIIIMANSSNLMSIQFQPISDTECPIDDDEIPPFTMKTTLIVTAFTELDSIERTVALSGLVSGPVVEYWPKRTELDLYVGEEDCSEITIRNIDKFIDAKVVYVSYVDAAVAHVTVQPTETPVLAVCETAKFTIHLYTRIVGKFQLKLRFKIKNGNFFYVVYKGTSRPVRMRVFPDMIELGSVPVAIPQKRSILLMNPLRVPVSVKCVSFNDGEEAPLVLNVAQTDEFLPVTIKDHIKQVMAKDEVYSERDSIVDLSARVKSVESFRSVDDDNSSVSTEFEDGVLWHIPDVAPGVVSKLKTFKLIEKPGCEEKVIEETMQTLMRFKYFDDLIAHQNYALTDWNALPTDPKEIYCGNEIFYLSPNTGKHMTLLIIPNKLGYHNRCLEVRCCPYMETDACIPVDSNALVPSDVMTSKIWIEYNCRLPELVWTTEISLDEIIYSGQDYDFEMLFENKSNIGGFIFYDVVPDSSDGVMTFRDDVWKFFINPYDYAYSVCTVMFRRFGDVSLPGIVKLVGQSQGTPFHINAHALPPRVRISVKEIYRRQNVLEEKEVYVYIHNITPTKTWLTFNLKNERYQSIEPQGYILNPQGQGMYIVLRTKYYDPEIYKNTLYVNVHYGRIVEIPITFNIEGMPIVFEPNIKEGLDTGFILTNTKYNFENNIGNYAKDIKVINFGERSYRLIITKLRSGDRKCAVSTANGRINIYPKNSVIEPTCHSFLHITADSYEPVNIYNEFRIQIKDMANSQRFTNILFIISAQFIKPEILWSRREVCFNYYRTHQFKDHSQIEVIQLRNIASVDIDTVKLSVVGPFKIKENFEDNYTKDLKFKLSGLQCREFIIELNKKAIKDEFCKYLTCGRIICTANGELQKHVPLCVRIFNPDLRILQPDVVLFKKQYESDFHIEIANIGCLDAQYKWKKIVEEINYVDQFENYREFAEELLSDVLRGLNLSDDDSDVDSIYERNMTLRFQKFRCRNIEIEDPIDVMEIIDEIYDNLDLEHKRYIIKFNDADNNNEIVSVGSSKSCVSKTIDSILSKLKLDDSYEVSDVSSDDCFKERTVYFYEKSGALPQGNQIQCQLHLPAIRNGYAMSVVFQLDVVGGATQIFNLTLVNLKTTVRLSKDSIYLGILPWYEMYKNRFRVLNVTQYEVKINIAAMPYYTKRRRNRIADGFVKIAQPSCFDMRPYASKRIKVEGIIGFSDEFLRDIKITANDSQELHVRLRGQGIMPMLSVADKLPRLEQSQLEIYDEYKLLQRIYHFEIFRSITEQDEELPIGEEEGAMEANASTSDFSLLSDTTSNSSSLSKTLERERRFYRLLQTYVLVSNNAELPDGALLTQLIETEKFLESLSKDDDLCTALYLVYRDYVRTVKCYDEKMPLNLRHFTAQPLPFLLLGYEFNLGLLKLNEVRKFKITLHFYGPGKLIAAARTAVKIHGMVVDFEVPQQTGDDREYLFYAAEQKAPDFFDKHYRNMYEREIDQQNDYKLKHAHSFDCDKNYQHHRQPRPLTAKELKSVHNYYNSLNKSIYETHRHHFILCKVFTNSKKNFSGTQLNVIILYKPEAKFYEVGQVIEDYLYIDLHLGPTLPILLRGMIKGKT